MKASAFLTMKLFFRRKQKKRDEHGSPNDQHHRSTNRCPGIASCARALGVIGSLRLTGVGHKPVDYELLRRWNPRETQKSLVQVANGRQLCFEVLGVDSERLPLEVQQSTVLETGISKLSRLMYMPSMMKMPLVPFGHECLSLAPP